MLPLHTYFEQNDKPAILKRLVKTYPHLLENDDLLEYAVIFKKARMYRYLSEKLGLKINLAKFVASCVSQKVSLSNIASFLTWIFKRKTPDDLDVNAVYRHRNAISYLTQYIGPLDTKFSGLTFLLKHGADADAVDDNGFSALYYALGKPFLMVKLRNLGFDFVPMRILFHDREIYQLLYSKNPPPPTPETTITLVTPQVLMLRVINVIAKMSCGGVVESKCWRNLISLRDQENNGIFHWLVKENYVTEALILLQACVQNGERSVLNKRNDEGRTCLFYVNSFEHYYNLIDTKYMEPYFRDRRGDTAIMFFYKRCSGSFRSLQCFSQAYYDFLEFRSGISALLLNTLHKCVLQKSNDSSILEHFKKFNPAFYNIRNIHGQTPLHLAKDPELKKKLIEIGCEPDAVDIFGNRACEDLVPSLQSICAKRICYSTFQNYIPKILKPRFSLWTPADFFYEKWFAHRYNKHYFRFADNAMQITCFLNI